MELSTNLALSYNGYTFARITKCQFNAPYKTFSGVEFTFHITIEPSDLIKGKNVQLDKLVIDLYLMKDSTELYLGQLRNRSISPSRLTYPRSQQQQLTLTTNEFLKLADETHHKELELKIRAQGLFQFDESVKNSSGGPLIDSEPVVAEGESHISFPHSEWLKILNNTGIERFDLITLRTSLPELPGSSVFTQAFDKLHEAQDKFSRGDWNAVGAACRSAIRTIMSLAQGQKKPMDYLLASVINNSERKKFSASVIAVWDTLNTATHQEGNLNENLPPADFQREDALLTLHLTAAAISYIAAVYK